MSILVATTLLFLSQFSNAQVGSTQAIAVAPQGAAAGFVPGQVVTIIPRGTMVQVPPQQPAPTQNQNAAAAALAALLKGMGGGTNSIPKGAIDPALTEEPPDDTDYETYSYPKNHIFNYGGTADGDIGNGLCTEKNKNMTQVKKGYCGMISDLLKDETSCAHKAMTKILSEAGHDGSGIGDLKQKYCSTFGSMKDDTQKELVFVQILAGLITKESGWNSAAQEGAWTRGDGALMGGTGLFQIGVNDSSKPDCGGVAYNIFDPKTNIRCGACIALSHLADDREIGHGVGDHGTVGIAKYFGPFRDGQAPKRNSIANATNQWCVASTGGQGSSAVADAVVPTSIGSSARAPAASR